MNNECPCGQPVWKIWEHHPEPNFDTDVYQHGTDDEHATCHSVDQTTREIYQEFQIAPDLNPNRPDRSDATKALYEAAMNRYRSGTQAAGESTGDGFVIIRAIEPE
jgi:hypothetical protein